MGKTGKISLYLLVFISLLSFSAPLISPYDPDKIDLDGIIGDGAQDEGATGAEVDRGGSPGEEARLRNRLSRRAVPGEVEAIGVERRGRGSCQRPGDRRGIRPWYHRRIPRDEGHVPGNRGEKARPAECHRFPGRSHHTER